jgi:hypothetical protein
VGCLRDCGLVRVEAVGRASVYSLAQPPLLEVLTEAEDVLAATRNKVALCPANGQPVTATAADLVRLRRRGFALEYFSVAWMIAEAAVAITAGIVAGSVALTGFGLDSLIELASAMIVIWQLRGETLGQDRDTRAVRLVGVTFLALAAYLTAVGIADLVTTAKPAPSPAGLAITAAALVVMPALAVATAAGPVKPQTGQAPCWIRAGSIASARRLPAETGRRSTITQIYEGTNQIQRVVMARQLLK